MGLINNFFSILFGGGRNAVRETIEVFRPNAEAEAVREAARSAAALASRRRHVFSLTRASCVAEFKGCFPESKRCQHPLPRS